MKRRVDSIPDATPEHATRAPRAAALTDAARLPIGYLATPSSVAATKRWAK